MTAPMFGTHLPVSRVMMFTNQFTAIRAMAIQTCGQKPRSGKNMSLSTTENIRYTEGTHSATFSQYHQDTRVPHLLPNARTIQE